MMAMAEIISVMIAGWFFGQTHIQRKIVIGMEEDFSHVVQNAGRKTSSLGTQSINQPSL